jgi:hypothetical protein
MHIALTWFEAMLNVSGFLLITEYCDDSLGCQDFHAQETLPYCSIELVHEFSTENREVGMIHVDHVKAESFDSGIVKISKGYMQSKFSCWLDWFSSETLQRVLWWL